MVSNGFRELTRARNSVKRLLHSFQPECEFIAYTQMVGYENSRCAWAAARRHFPTKGRIPSLKRLTEKRVASSSLFPAKPM